MPKHKVRLVPRSVAGIPAKSDAPFWRGERAETIVSKRVSAIAEEKARKAAARKRKRK